MAKGRIQPNNKSQDDKFNYRLNNDIRVPRVRLVGDNLEEVSEVAGKTIETGIFNTYQVIQWAEEMEMDLVEISPNADPPVCKIIDYKKFIYDRKKKEKEL
ncbi:MAG TPA: translation initiation factor IF-3, partial [Saprospiraceae bacterium]|nr:translation initiation factor IF-3 [Saprospiraceae bacterium]